MRARGAAHVPRRPAQHEARLVREPVVTVLHLKQHQVGVAARLRERARVQRRVARELRRRRERGRVIWCIVDWIILRYLHPNPPQKKVDFSFKLRIIIEYFFNF